MNIEIASMALEIFEMEFRQRNINDDFYLLDLCEEPRLKFHKYQVKFQSRK